MRVFQDNSPFKLVIPNWTWREDLKKVWIAEDKSPTFDRFRFSPSDMSISWFGGNSWFDSNDRRHCCYDSDVKSSTVSFSMNSSTNWASQSGGSCEDSCQQYVSVNSYPDYLENQGIRPPGLYTLEPHEDNFDMKVTRSARSGACMRPVGTTGPFLVARSVNHTEEKSYYTEPFEIAQQLPTPVQASVWANWSSRYVQESATTPHYRKQNVDGSWPSKIESRSSQGCLMC